MRVNKKYINTRGTSSIFSKFINLFYSRTPTVRAILLADRSIYHSQKSLLILIPCHVLRPYIIKYGHPIVIKLHELHSELIQDGKELVFVWVLGHVGISGNSAAYTAAKDALDGDVWNEDSPFSDSEPRLNNDIAELWQKPVGHQFPKQTAQDESQSE